jgi:pSer/pThr/pTyr-binding forkhead associated (FHA) protein
MLVKLVILHGKLQDRRGRKAKQELKIRPSLFVIGSASDCSMRCSSERISPHHCQLRREPNRVVLEDLASKTGTFGNGVRLEGPRPLKNGDRLQVGRLEFEVLIEDSSPVWELEPRVDGGDTIHDALSETVCDLLSAEDEKERQRRLQNPDLRQFSLPSAGKPTGQVEDRTARAKRTGEAGRRRTKRRPGKLPVRPRWAKDASVAAAEMLPRVFGKRQG